MQQGAKDYPAVFLVHNVAGEVLSYADLVGNLGEAYPCYGLQAPGLICGQTPRLSLEEMATQYLEAVEMMNPVRPFALGGWSFGGVLAFEMARQLNERGEMIGLLFCIDAYAPIEAEEDELTEHETLFRFAETMNLPENNIEKMKRSGQSNLKESLAELKTMLQKNRRSEFAYKQQDIERLFSVFQSNLKALFRYIPQSIGVPMLLFKGRGSISNRPDLGWSELVTGNIDVVTLPGDHYAVIREPSAAIIAQELSKRLGQLGTEDRRV
jgi:thioesterase domain-containing protein